MMKKKKVIKEQPKKKQTILDSSSDEESQGEDLHESDDEEELKVTPIDLETVEEESNDGEEEINSVTSIPIWRFASSSENRGKPR